MVAVLVDYIKYMPTDDRCATTMTPKIAHESNCVHFSSHSMVVMGVTQETYIYEIDLYLKSNKNSCFDRYPKIMCIL